MPSVLFHWLRWQVGLAEPETWTSEGERACLARHAAGARRVAEVGVWHAGTSRTIRRAMAADGTFFAVDPYEKGRLGFSIPRTIARRELGRIPNGRVVWVRYTGHEAVGRPEVREQPFDFVFIDAPQTYDVFRGEWEAWTPLIAAGGLIALHDSAVSPLDPTFLPDSIRYVQEVAVQDPRFAVVDVVESVTVFRRRGGDR